MNTSSEHLPKRAKTAALRQVQVCFHSAKTNEGVYQYIEREFAKICEKDDFKARLVQLSNGYPLYSLKMCNTHTVGIGENQKSL